MTMFDEDIKRRLSDYQEPEPEGLWDDILSGLNAADAADAEAAETAATAAPQMQHRRPRRVIIYTVSSIAAAAAIVLGVFLMPRGETAVPTISVVEHPGMLADNEIPAEEPAKGPEATEKPVPAEVHAEEPAKATGSAEEQVPAPEDTPIVTPGESGQNTEEYVHTLQADQTELLAEAILEHTERKTTAESGQKEQGNDHSTEYPRESGQNTEEYVHTQQADQTKQEEKPISIYSEEYKYMANLDLAEDVVEKVRRKRTSIGLMADGVVIPGSSSSGYNQTFNQTGGGASQASIQLNGMTVDPIKNIRRMNKGQDITTSTRYTPPVRSGLMFRWTYKSGFGIETGLQYSYMKSVTESGTDANFSRINTECQFLGIPFNLSYSFWDNRYMSAYINAGILMERRISLESVTRYYANGNELGNPVYDAPDVSKYQWSANASAGIQFNALRWLGIFAEPGVTYFMNNESLYGDHRWNFNVRLGLRFDISSKK